MNVLLRIQIQKILLFALDRFRWLRFAFKACPLMVLKNITLFKNAVVGLTPLLLSSPIIEFLGYLGFLFSVGEYHVITCRWCALLPRLMYKALNMSRRHINTLYVNI